MSAVNIGLAMKPRHALWTVRGQHKHDSPSSARASSANARKQTEIFSRCPKNPQKCHVLAEPDGTVLIDRLSEKRHGGSSMARTSFLPVLWAYSFD
jgi:hypothetical protein